MSSTAIHQTIPVREDFLQARHPAMATVGTFRCGAEFLKLADMKYGKLQVSSVTTAVLMLLDNGGMPDTLHGFRKCPNAWEESRH